MSRRTVSAGRPACACSRVPSATARSTWRCGTSGSAHAGADPERRAGSHRPGRAARGARAAHGTDDRLPAGGKRALGRVRPVRRPDRGGARGRAPGCTSTARSACGPRRLRRCAHLTTAWPAPIRGARMPTRRSTSPTTAAWRSSPTVGDEPGVRPLRRVLIDAVDPRPARVRPRALPPRARACRSGRRSRHSAATGVRDLVDGLVTCGPARSPRDSPRCRAPRSSTTSSTPRSASRSRTTRDHRGARRAAGGGCGAPESQPLARSRPSSASRSSNWQTDETEVAETIEAFRRALAATA